MPTLQIEHAVRDYDSWKAAFDSDPVGREQEGDRLPDPAAEQQPELRHRRPRVRHVGRCGCIPARTPRALAAHRGAGPHLGLARARPRDGRNAQILTHRLDRSWGVAGKAPGVRRAAQYIEYGKRRTRRLPPAASGRPEGGSAACEDTGQGRSSPVARPPLRRPPGRRLRRLLEPGCSAAPERHCLALLPSGPDAVRRLPMRGTWLSTLRAPAQTPDDSAPRTVLGPAIADCGQREPLAPRLARPGRTMVSHVVHSRFPGA